MKIILTHTGMFEMHRCLAIITDNQYETIKKDLVIDDFYNIDLCTCKMLFRIFDFKKGQFKTAYKSQAKCMAARL